MREIFNSPTMEMALEMVRRTVERCQKKALEFVKWLEANIEEGLTVYQFPKEHWRRIRTSNGMERVNREIKQRTRVAILFPNKESALRLITGVLIEIHEEWVTGKQFRLKGYEPQQATFERRTDAKLWAQQTEAAIREGRHFKTTEATNPLLRCVQKLKMLKFSGETKLGYAQLVRWSKLIRPREKLQYYDNLGTGF